MTFKKLRIVTLRSAPSASVDVPELFPKKRGKSEDRRIERSVHGSIRLFPGVPKAVTEDELEYIRATRSDIATRLDDRPYVESKRRELRGATEGEIAELAAKEGIDHLPTREQHRILVDRGKLQKPKPPSVKPHAEDRSKAKPTSAKAPDVKSSEGKSGKK